MQNYLHICKKNINFAPRKRFGESVTMKQPIQIALLFVFGIVFLCPDSYAAGGKEQIVWGKKPGHKTGLYTTQNHFVAQGLSLSVNALYYFGDVDNEGMAFHGGFNTHNLSLGGGLSLVYHMPVSKHCNLRFALSSGMLGGNNEEKFNNLDPPRDDYRSFKSFYVQPAFGVQCYPFSNAGFYLYAGIALTASFITHYEFYYYAYQEGSNEKTREKIEGSTYGFLPMVQGGLGYSWQLTNAWSLSAEFRIEYGVVDLHYMNLDAYPMVFTQNNKEINRGSTTGKWIGRDGAENSRWNDGWFMLGITVAYQWRRCEHCRIINNYRHIRGRRH